MSEVCYEHQMFSIAVGRVGQVALAIDGAAGDDQAVGLLGIERNAWVEVALLHLRNLIAFYQAKANRDDVLASHYVEGWTADAGGPSLDALATLAVGMHKRLAHITAYRVRVPRHEDVWYLEEARDHLWSVFKVWFDQLSDEQRTWFELVPDPK